jgi:crossover junction endodeoxyribonuclease RuvC
MAWMVANSGYDGGERSLSERVRILGLDPGLRNTGWGVITVEGTKLSLSPAGS